MLPLLSLVTFCYPLLPLLPIVTPCYPLLPLLPFVTSYYPLLPIVTPCYPLLPLGTLVTLRLCYPLLLLVTSCRAISLLVLHLFKIWLFPAVLTDFPTLLHVKSWKKEKENEERFVERMSNDLKLYPGLNADLISFSWCFWIDFHTIKRNKVDQQPPTQP